MQSKMNILQVKSLSKFFGGLAAVSNCSLKIKKGSITGIIGPNGSGKTTLFNLIAGNLESTKGTVLFNDEDITNIPSFELFSKGVLRTFQIAHEFSNLTVLENLMMVPGNQSGENLANALLKPNLIKKEEEQIKQKALKATRTAVKKALFKVGDTVNIDSKKGLLVGTITKMNRTRAICDIKGKAYNVPFGMMEAV